MNPVTRTIRCPNTDVFAVLSGSLIINNGSRTVVGERCNLRDDLLRKEWICNRACGLGSASSPLRNPND